MKQMKLFKNREFDPAGLELVLMNIFIPVVAIGIFISIVCYPKFWGIIAVFGIIVGVAWAIVYAIWKAFNMIFPKKRKDRYGR